MTNNKKIGIVTLHGYFNYGNRLQNYALKHTLETLNFDVYTTIINDQEMIRKNRVRKAVKELKTNPLKIISKGMNKIKNKNQNKNINQERLKIFEQFSSEYLNERFYELTSEKDLSKITQYDYFVTGSDQVWNPMYFTELPIYFLTFAEKQKRVAYSPSISRDKLPNELEEDYKKWLEGMSAVSVREEAGSKIIKDLTGIQAPVLADPTLLLNREEWLDVANPASNRPNSPYILTYFLGGPSETTKVELEKIAKEKNMTIINLGDINEIETYETGPREFIDYINNASAFLTDSYHGVVYSIILETPFVVFKRRGTGPSMYSRIETLLDKYEMRDREKEAFKGDIFLMDFSKTKDVLDGEQKKSILYLKDSLN